MKFSKFLRTPILKNICERLLLKIAALKIPRNYIKTSFKESPFNKVVNFRITALLKKGSTTCLLILLTLREKCPYSALFWPVFSLSRTEYGKILCIYPYLVRMLENIDQNNSEYGHFSSSASCSDKLFLKIYSGYLSLTQGVVLQKPNYRKNQRKQDNIKA